MIKIVFSFVILIMISACSFKAKPNEWKYKSVNAFSSYTKNFLSNNDDLANSDLKRAIEHAKQGGDLTQLSRIYLGKCALNLSVGIKDQCSEYNEIKSLVKDKSLDSYNALITSSIGVKDIESIDSRYRDFAKNIIDKRYDDAKDDMFSMEQVTSKLVAASLIMKYLNVDEVSKLIDEVSYYGYKKSLLYLLEIKKEKSLSILEKEAIDKKIKAII